MIKLIFIDISGTLIKGSGTNSGAEFLGKGDTYRKFNPKYLLGEMSIDELLKRTFACWRGLKVADLPNIYNKLALGYNGGVKETIKKIKEKGIKIALLTNIPTHLGAFFQEELKPNYITGSVLEVRDGIFTGKVLEFHNDKVKDAMEILKKENISPHEAIAIGDRKHDAKVFEKVRFGVAYNGDEIARKLAKYQIDDFRELIGIIEKDIVEELRETPLKIKQKIVKLSQDRLGIYLNNHVVRSLNLKKGEEVYVSVPDKKRIVVELE